MSINPNINPENINQKKFQHLNCFRGTKVLKEFFSSEDLKIESNVRTFKSKEKDSGYDEIFSNEDSELFGGISNQISFLYPIGIRGYQNRIGFRYYKYDPLSTKADIPYFTLVRNGIRQFLILEKESSVKDINDKSFIIKDLDCLDIILTIIKIKIKKDEDGFTYANSMSEILGFIYASKCVNNCVNNIDILYPFIPNPFIKETLIEEEKDIDTSKFFIEPIMYNKHISLLFFYYQERRSNYCVRKNIIFDMSSSHYNKIIKKEATFPEEMRYDLIKFPNNNIQRGNSCSIWFYASLLFLLQEKIEIPFENIALYKIIEKLYDLLDIKNRDIYKSKIVNREFENIDKNLFVSYKLALKPFIDIDSFLSQFNSLKNIGPEGLGDYQKLYIEIKYNINILRINIKYYKKVFNENIISKNKFSNYISLLESAEKSFFSIIETRKKLWEYYSKNTGESLNDLNKNVEYSIKNYISLIKDLRDEYANINNKYTLYSTHILHEYYFDKSDTFMEIMDN